MKKSSVMILLLFMACNAGAKQHKTPEKYYQLKWCAEHEGQAEVRLSDGTRCDCITATHAIEFDFAHKWAEAIGQSLHYSGLTGKRAGIVIIGTIAADNASFDHLVKTIADNSLKIDVLQKLPATKLQQKPLQ